MSLNLRLKAKEEEGGGRHAMNAVEKFTQLAYHDIRDS